MSTTPLPADVPADSMTASWPYAATLTLQIVCFSLLGAILLYLTAHWVFHSWSFVNILGLSRGKRSMVAMTVVIWSLYTLYVGSFIYGTVSFLQSLRSLCMCIICFVWPFPLPSWQFFRIC
ncbi:hypothetical protein BCR44DRAFT_45643, partial [Catenaria anguillulae PL171]